MRGRKPQGEKLRATRALAKGDPGKRVSKRKRASIEQAASALAGAAAGDGETSFAAPKGAHPKFLDDKRMAAALTIWRELEPDLRRLQLLQPLDRFTFAMYCVHMADWITATRDIQRRGQWKNVKNVNGDPLPRMNPSVKVREIAERHILDISTRFGLDPANRYRLLRDQAAAPLPSSTGQAELPLNDAAQPAPAATVAELASPLGLMEDLATAPPGSRPN